MKLSSILLVLLWNNVELTLTQKVCSKLPTVEHAFVSDQYKKAEYQEGDVIYFSCDPGYTTGLNTTYVCTEHGWRAATIGQCIEYTVPVPLGCTPPPPLKHGYVLNNSTYFYGNGQRVVYRCNHSYTLKGGPHKTCTSGQWTGNLQCLSTTCEKPLVDNGEVQGDKETFVVNEVLTYSCDPGYRKVDDRPSVCLRLYLRTSQWSPRPQCEAILCQLSHNPPNGTTYDPPNQIIFQPGQRVRVSCGEKQWVKSKELQSAELTCQDTGHWDFEPVCQLVTCFKIDENIYHWQRTQYNTVEMDETLWYRCHRGYEETSRRAKCTRRGWEPDPLCKLPSCEMPLIDNGVALPQIGEDGVNMILIYTCNEGYKKVNTLSVCRKLGSRTLWSPRPQCEAITCKLSLNPLNQLIFNPGQSTRVLCGEKQWVKSKELQSAELTCQDTGRWDFDPECQQVTCSKTAENVYWEHTYNNTVEMGRILRYMCYPGYHNTGRWAKCTRQGWEPDPLCKVAQ